MHSGNVYSFGSGFFHNVCKSHLYCECNFCSFSLLSKFLFISLFIFSAVFHRMHILQFFFFSVHFLALDCFQFRTITNCAAVNILVLLGIELEVELLGHNICILAALIDTTGLTQPICLPSPHCLNYYSLTGT